MSKLLDKVLDLPFPLVFTFIVIMMPAFIVTIAACSTPKPVENHGWRETESPRPDLQCWVRWNESKSTVCAPSLTSTHGASQ